ncbi:MAG: hypothetical protein ABR976_00920 [Terracidiphilus sp.]
MLSIVEPLAGAASTVLRVSPANIRPVREQIGYELIVDFMEGLRCTVEWYRAGGRMN